MPPRRSIFRRLARRLTACAATTASDMGLGDEQTKTQTKSTPQGKPSSQSDTRSSSTTMAGPPSPDIERPTSTQDAAPDSASPRRSKFFPPSRRTVVYAVTVVCVALATAGVMALWQNIIERKKEAQQHVFQVVDLNETVIDPAEWGKNFPRQFDSYRRTVYIARTRHGGSDAFQKLDEDPRWRVLFQ